MAPQPSKTTLPAPRAAALVLAALLTALAGCSQLIPSNRLWIFGSSREMGAAASIDRPALAPPPLNSPPLNSNVRAGQATSTQTASTQTGTGSASGPSGGSLASAGFIGGAGRAKPEILSPVIPASEHFGAQRPLDVVSTADNPLDLKPSDLKSLSKQSSSNPNNGPQEISLQSLASYRVQEGEISAFVVTRDGLGVITGGVDGRVIFSRIITSDPNSKQASAGRRLERRTILQGSKPILSLAISTDNRYVAVGQFSSVLVFDLQKQMLVAQLTQLIGRVTALAWDPRDELLAVGLAGGDVSIWQLRTGSYPGANSMLAVEKYTGSEGSPVMRLLFHPLGRVLFAGHRSGIVSAWRVIRAEFEAGLRDEEAVGDLDRKGGKRIKIGNTTGPLQDIWLDRSNNAISAIGIDGAVVRWELRGTTALPVISVGEDNAYAAALFQQTKPASGGQIFASIGHAQRLIFWCIKPLSETPEIVSKPGDVPIYKEAPAQAASSGDFEIVNGQVVAIRKEAALEPGTDPATTRGINKNKATLKPLANTTILQDPVSLMQLGEKSSVLWGVQKNGRLLAFDARPLLEQLVASESCR